MQNRPLCILAAAAATLPYSFAEPKFAKNQGHGGFNPCTKIARPIVQCIDSFLMSIDAASRAKLRWQSESTIHCVSEVHLEDRQSKSLTEDHNSDSTQSSWTVFCEILINWNSLESFETVRNPKESKGPWGTLRNSNKPIVYIVIVFYTVARAVRALSFGLLHWLSRQRQHCWETTCKSMHWVSPHQLAHRLSFSFVDLLVDLLAPMEELLCGT